MNLPRATFSPAILVCACVLLWAAWALPALLALTSGFNMGLLRKALLLTYEGMIDASLRSTLVVAIVLPLLIVTATLFAALLLSGVRAAENRATVAMLLLAPALTGPMTFAFLWKHAHLGSDYGAGLSSDLIALLPWTLGQAFPLMTGFLILSFSHRMRREAAYGAAAHVCAFRVALLSLLGHQKWLIAGFSFVLGSVLFNDRVLTELALRPSDGASNELISHALERVYRRVSFDIDPTAATQLIFAYGMSTAVIASCVIAAVTYVTLCTLSWIARHWSSTGPAPKPLIITAICLLIPLLWTPALIALPTLREPLSAIHSLTEHASATSLCGLVVLIAGIAAGAASFQRWAIDKRPKAAEIGIVLFLTVPAAAIGLGWMYSAGQLANWSRHAYRAAWMFAATASYFPLGFLLASLAHRYIDPRSFKYSLRVGISEWRFESIAFVRAFPTSLLALYTIFALSIWSDWGASAAFATMIEVFGELLLVATSGRAENAASAASLSWLTILLSSIAALLVARSSLKHST